MNKVEEKNNTENKASNKANKKIVKKEKKKIILEDLYDVACEARYCHGFARSCIVLYVET